MSLSKRKSRKIVVDDLEYRWSPSQDSGYMVLTVQHVSGRGMKIETFISDGKNIVIENGSYSIEVGSVDKLIITPGLVRKVIQDARLMGWNPLENGKPLMLRLNENEMKLQVAETMTQS